VPAPAAAPTISKSNLPTQMLRPAALASSAAAHGTVFNARMAQFGRAAEPAALPQAGAYRSMASVRNKHDELSMGVLGAKGVEPDTISTVLDFMEAVARSGVNFHDDRQRAALSQILTFWTRKVSPHMERPPAMMLADFSSPY